MSKKHQINKTMIFLYLHCNTNHIRRSVVLMKLSYLLGAVIVRHNIWCHQNANIHIPTMVIEVADFKSEIKIGLRYYYHCCTLVYRAIAFLLSTSTKYLRNRWINLTSIFFHEKSLKIVTFFVYNVLRSLARVAVQRRGATECVILLTSRGG